MPEVTAPPGAGPLHSEADGSDAGSSDAGSSEAGSSEAGSSAAAPGAMRREMWAGLAVILLLAGGVVGKRLVRAVAARPSVQQCEELLDHQLAHASRQRHPDVQDDDVDRAQARARQERSRVTEVDRCRRRLTASEVECGLRAPNVDELERCLQ